MSRSFVAGTNRMELAAAPITAWPFTLAIWFAPSATQTSSRGMIVLADAGSNAQSLQLGGNSSLFTPNMSTFDGSIIRANATADCTTLDVWYHAAGTVSGDDARAAFLDGGNKGTNSSSQSTVTPTRTRIGNNAGNTNDYEGLLAHPAMWNVVLSDDEIAMLGAGRVSPLFVRPQNLVFYAPHLGRDTSDIDIIGGRVLTNVGPTVSNNEPPMLWLPGKRRIFLPSAGQSGSFSLPASMGATFGAVAASLGSVTAGVAAGQSVTAAAATLGFITVALALDDAGAGQDGLIADVSVDADADIAASALADALAAVLAGAAAGEVWAAAAVAAALLAAGSSLGVEFSSEIQAAQEGALAANSTAAAQFVGAATTLASLVTGATLADAIAGVAVSLGSLTAGAGLGAVIASLGQNDVALSAPLAAAAVFQCAAVALGALSVAAGFDALIAAAAITQAELGAGASFGAAFTAEGGAVTILPPARATLRVSPRVTSLRVPSKLDS